MEPTILEPDSFDELADNRESDNHYRESRAGLTLAYEVIMGTMDKPDVGVEVLPLLVSGVFKMNIVHPEVLCVVKFHHIHTWLGTTVKSK